MIDTEEGVATIKAAILSYMLKNNIHISRSSVLKLMKKTNELSKDLNIAAGYLDYCLWLLLPKRRSETVLREIEIISGKMMNYSKKSKSSSGAYQRDMLNFNHKLRLLKEELGA